MVFAKLINNYPVYAPNPIIYNGYRIGNPPASIYLELGYKPVQFNDPPETPLTETGWWSEIWTEEPEQIGQGWIWQEPEDE